MDDAFFIMPVDSENPRVLIYVRICEGSPAQKYANGKIHGAISWLSGQGGKWFLADDVLDEKFYGYEVSTGCLPDLISRLEQAGLRRVTFKYAKYAALLTHGSWGV